MKIDLWDEILAAVEAKRGEWTDQDVDLGIRLGETYATLMGQKIAGANVSRELEMVAAGLRNVGAATTITGADLVNRVIIHALAALAKVLIPMA